MSGVVPEGWKIVKVKDIAEIIRGVSFGKDDASVVKGDNSIAILRGGNIQDGKIIDNEDLVYVDAKFVSTKQIIRNGDVIIVGSTGSKKLIGKAAHSLFDYSDVSFGAFLTMLRPIGVVNPRFFNYYFQTEYYRDEIRKLAGGININNIKNQHLEGLVFPFPPLAEQQRLVTKLDALFGSLEQLKSRLNTIPQLLKTFRQAVLTQAVTGKLTREWREGKVVEEWRTEKASECCEKVQSGGTPKSDGFANEGIPFLKVYNIVNNNIDFKYRPQFITKLAHSGSGKKSIGLPGDVLMNIVGPPLNKIAILPNDYSEWNLNQAITLFRPKDYLSNKFLYYYFCEGRSVNSLVNETRGVVGQINISLSQCRDFEILLPPLPEQHEIVRRVEGLLSKADAIEARYRALKGQVDALPQAVLGKAFRGEWR